LDELAEKSLVIKAAAYRSDAHDFNLMASITCPNQTRGEDIPSSDFQSKKGVPAWKKGQVIRIEQNEFPYDNWYNCTVDIVVDVVDSGEYYITATTNDAIPKLYNEKLISDIVKIDNLQCYSYYLTNPENVFSIYLTAYSGRLDVGV